LRSFSSETRQESEAIFTINRADELISAEVENQFMLRAVQHLLAMMQQGGNSQTGDGRE
jgi:hypothetical protein